jgi:hypothetical protein
MAIESSIFALAVAILLHGSLVRLFKGINTVICFILEGVFVGLLLFLYLIYYEGISYILFASLLIYMLACEIYIFIFTLVMSSISANIILGIGDKKMNLYKYEGESIYIEMVQERVSRLESNGFIEKSKSGYLVTPKGYFLNQKFIRLKYFFKHK